MSEGANTLPARAEREAREAAPEPGCEGVVPARAKTKTPARVVVVGEFNSGKTTLVNALAGAPVLAPSFVTRTLHQTVIGFAPRPALFAETAPRKRVRLGWDRLENPPLDGVLRLHVGVPVERLKSFRLVDTPGIGLDEDEGEDRVLRHCRQASAVIWCTPAMQAWKASEERAWLTLPKRVRQRGILAVTFEDAVASPSDLGRLLMRLRAEAGAYFRKIVLASDRSALLPQLPCEKDGAAGRVRGGHAGMLEGVAAGPLR